jgi:hypothetical protein
MTLSARWRAGTVEWQVRLDAPVSLAIPVRFDARGVRHFGAPPAGTAPFAVGDFSGEVARGASCNCRSITLIPHCHGTHTECAGHLTAAPLHAARIAPRTLQAALLLTVTPKRARDTDETSRPSPQPDDLLVTRAALDAAFRALPAAAQQLPTTAMIIRTAPNDAGKLGRDYSDGRAPYLTLGAVAWLLEHDTQHVVLDLPSLDRSHDDGELAGHRLFFGLPPRHAAAAPTPLRAHCTITELAFVPDAVADGAVLLQLTLPAIDGDAVPSEPLLYPLEVA